VRNLKNLKSALLVAIGVYVKEMKIWFRYSSWIFTFIALPYMISGLFNGIGYAIAGDKAVENFAKNTGISNPFLFYTLGTALLLASEIIISDFGNSIRSEQLNGTFELHYLSPTPTYVIWMFHLFPHSTIMFIVLLATTIPVLVVSSVIVSLPDLLIALFIFIVGMIPLIGIAFILASLVVRFKEPWAIVNLINNLISLLSGFLYPLTIFPEWVRLVANLVPTSYVVDVLREVFLFNRHLALNDIRFFIFFLLVALYPSFGLTLYKRWENEARRKGELSKY